MRLDHRRRKLNALLKLFLMLIVLSGLALLLLPKLLTHTVFEDDRLRVRSHFFNGSGYLENVLKGGASVEFTESSIEKMKALESSEDLVSFDNGSYGYKGRFLCFTDDIHELEELMEREILHNSELIPLYPEEDENASEDPRKAFFFSAYIEDDHVRSVTIEGHRGEWNGIPVKESVCFYTSVEESPAYPIEIEIVTVTNWTRTSDQYRAMDELLKPDHATYETKQGYTAELFYEAGCVTLSYLFHDGDIYVTVFGTDDLSAVKEYLDGMGTFDVLH